MLQAHKCPVDKNYECDQYLSKVIGSGSKWGEISWLLTTARKVQVWYKVYLRNHSTWSSKPITPPIDHLTANYERNVFANNVTQGLHNKDFCFFKYYYIDWQQASVWQTREQLMDRLLLLFIGYSRRRCFCFFCTAQDSNKMPVFCLVATFLLFLAKGLLSLLCRVAGQLVFVGCKWDAPLFSETCQDFYVLMIIKYIASVNRCDCSCIFGITCNYKKDVPAS